MALGDRRSVVIGPTKNNPGHWDTRDIITSQDINGNIVELYDGPLRSESYENLISMKKTLRAQLSLINNKLDGIALITGTVSVP